MNEITYDQLTEIAPQGDADLRRALARSMTTILPIYRMDTPLRAAHFIGQVVVETDYFRTLVEYGNGRSYENRKDLGNIDPGDGPLFKGRGPLQVTGRANYGRAALRVGLPLLDEPERLAEPELGTLASCVWWYENKMNQWADLDSATAVSRGVNRGNPRSSAKANHEDARIAATARAKIVLDARSSVPASDDRETIRAIQHALNDAGFGLLVEDGIYGPMTLDVVRSFQATVGLVPDGIVGPKTRAALGLS